MGERSPLIAVVGMVREAKIIARAATATVIGGGDSKALDARLEAALAALPPFPLDGGRAGDGGVGSESPNETRLGAKQSPSPDPREHTPNPALPPSPSRLGRGKGFLLSFGVCGALAPGLKAGDLILGDAVIAGSERWTTNADWTARLAAALPGAQRADVAASDAMIGSVADKEALYRATGAKVVDMESHIAARIAARHGLAFAVVRAVSDAADHTLPAAALAGLRPDGQPDITAVLWSLAKNPAQLPALLRTAREAEAGFRALERAAGAFSAAS